MIKDLVTALFIIFQLKRIVTSEDSLVLRRERICAHTTTKFRSMNAWPSFLHHSVIKFKYFKIQQFRLIPIIILYCKTKLVKVYESKQGIQRTHSNPPWFPLFLWPVKGNRRENMGTADPFQNVKYFQTLNRPGRKVSRCCAN